MDTTEFDSDVAVREDETSLVIAWREQRFLALGYSNEGATLLACAPIDIHEVERLIQRGCPLDLAIEIAA